MHNLHVCQLSSALVNPKMQLEIYNFLANTKIN